MSKTVIAFAASLVVVVAQQAAAAVPEVVSVQGILKDAGGTEVADGDVSVTFRVYDAAAAVTSIWDDTITVTTSDGRFTVLLGQDTKALGLAFDAQYWLGIEVESDGEMTPRFQLAAAPYAITSAHATTADAATDADTVDGLHAADFALDADLTAHMHAVDDLSDATVTSPADGEILAFDPVDGWTNQTAVDLGLATAAALNDGDTGTTPVGWDDVDAKPATFPPDAHTHSSLVDSSGAPVERVVVDTAGNVGIGTATPGATLDVAGAFLVDTSGAVANIVGGHSGNAVTAGAVGATVFGGTGDYGGSPYPNTVTDQYGTIGGGAGNQAGDDAGTVDDTEFATVGGGYLNVASGGYATIGGGWMNIASAQRATVGGGDGNTAGGANATVGGGDGNAAGGSRATVAGGQTCLASANGATVGGGQFNNATGTAATVGGGATNTASGYSATVAGGCFDVASGDYSFAAGYRAKTQTAAGSPHTGAFVWADSNNFDFNSTADNEFSARATGGFRLVTAIDGAGVPTAGVTAGPGAGSWASVSDRNAKKDFTPVDGEGILAKVAEMPVTYWRYTWQDESVTPLIGPVAQDLVGAFYPGADDTVISTQQADGVHFAAIKALEARTCALSDQNAALRRDNDELRRELAELRALVESLAETGK